MSLDPSPSPLNRLIRFCIEQKLVVILFMIVAVAWGTMVAPFDWKFGGIPRDPVPVDAIPDIGENQQIVFTKWSGRSPQDIDDQISYPLTVSLLGIPHVKTVRSYSIFGFSSIYVIFDDEADFYWSRSRIIEKLNSLPSGTLPEGVAPALGPDATALGQVFWYTLEGRDPNGKPSGGWDLNELRTVQDWTVRYALLGADGVSEVASIGGFVQEYQIDVDPNAMRAYDVTIDQVFSAVRKSNVDVGARTIEVNKAEYVVRGLGFVKTVEDLESVAVVSRKDTPVFVRDIAHVTLGPAGRRGALDKAGAEAVGGVVIVRYGDNPLRVIQNVKEKIAEISVGLPTKTLADGTTSQVTIVPFYDRTGLIYETLGTLNESITLEILVTIIVVILMVLHLRSSILISSLLPITVLMTFIGMKTFGVDANIVALSGIAIAVGTIVDLGIVLCENILRRLDEASPDDSSLEVIYRASTEVGSAVLTAVLTTIVSFLPVFTMEAAEGKLFRPLAWTKSFALISAIIVALTIIPPFAHILFGLRLRRGAVRVAAWSFVAVLGLVMLILGYFPAGVVTIVFAAYWIVRPLLPDIVANLATWGTNLSAVFIVLMILARAWEPLGPEVEFLKNALVVSVPIVGLIVLFYIFQLVYPHLLRAALIVNPLVPILILVVAVVLGPTVWLGFDKVFNWLPDSVRSKDGVAKLAHDFPGLGSEFMPALDEGSFLYMPTAMPHASIGEALDVIQKLDMAVAAIPEVNEVVGKIGRADTPLDPAPISMVETIINYKSEYMLDKNGHRLRFTFDEATKQFVRDESGLLIPDAEGKPFRQWRDEIRSAQDIWDEIVRASELPGTTSAPKLQPIQTRIVMLQSGFRAAMGVKVFGPDLETIESFALEMEQRLKEVPAIEPASVFADRIVGKPYVEIDIDRERIARYGISIQKVQSVIEVAIGGKQLTTTVEGRERYPVRVRYMRELRDNLESLEEILIPAADGRQIPLIELATINHTRGPQMIKSEDTFLVGYVLFDKKPENAEVDVVLAAQAYLKTKIEAGELTVPAGVSYQFAGSYENQVRASKRLMVVIPISLMIIFLILYFQFRSVLTTLIVFSGVVLGWSGGFLMIWLYNQHWFMSAEMFAFLPPRPEALFSGWWIDLESWLGTPLRELFQIRTVNLSVAVWVGFLALFGIATDNGVILATLLNQVFDQRKPDTARAIRQATIEGGHRRARACLMTTATTILALIPILTSTGRGSDIMIPMAIPVFGGMAGSLLTLFVVPTLYCFVQQIRHAGNRMLSPVDGAPTNST